MFVQAVHSVCTHMPTCMTAAQALVPCYDPLVNSVADSYSRPHPHRFTCPNTWAPGCTVGIKVWWLGELLLT